MSEHRYDIRISEAVLDPNPLRVERQDPDNFPRLQTRKRCALEIAAYVFNPLHFLNSFSLHNSGNSNKKPAALDLHCFLQYKI